MGRGQQSSTATVTARSRGQEPVGSGLEDLEAANTWEPPSAPGLDDERELHGVGADDVEEIGLEDLSDDLELEDDLDLGYDEETGEDDFDLNGLAGARVG